MRPRKLTSERVRELRRLHQLKRSIPSIKQMARIEGVVESNIRNMLYGRTYKEIKS